MTPAPTMCQRGQTELKTHTLLRNTKALSPVIATIILVAVTVAIAIAVAAWLGALTFTYTNVEQINITGAAITITGSSVAFGISNSGTSDVVISSATVNGGSYTNAAGTLPTAAASSTVCGVTGGLATIPKGSSCTLTGTFTSGGAFVAGTTYAFKLISTKGHTFPYTTTA